MYNIVYIKMQKAKSLLICVLLCSDCMPSTPAGLYKAAHMQRAQHKYCRPRELEDDLLHADKMH